MPLSGIATVGYWNEEGYERTELLGLFTAYLLENRWGTTVDSGWSDWDLEVHCHPWTVVQVSTAQEDYGGGKRLIRARYRLRLSGYLKALGAGCLLAAVAGVGLLAWPAALEARLLLGACAAVASLCLGLWWRGTRRASQVVAVFDTVATGMGLVRCQALPWQQHEGAAGEPTARQLPAAP